MSVSSDAVFEPLPDVRFRAVGGEGVVVRQDAAEVMVLNGVGARVLELLDGARTVAAVLDTLAQEYDVGRPDLEHDILAYLGELLEAGVIRDKAA